MNPDLALSAIAMKQAQTQQLAQIKMMKAQQQMQSQLIEMIDKVTQSAPVPKGQGGRVDKSA